jgi:prepilin-type processing-associated H-X9-DG protein
MVVVLVFLGIGVAILLPVFDRNPSGTRSVCQTNLKRIGLAIKVYVQDYDEKFPLVNSGGRGWVDTLQPYIKSTEPFQCPSESSGANQGKTDYFYNARLSGVEERKLTVISNTIMSGDGVGESAGNASLSQFPASWATDHKSPAWRHLERANYVYSDGHVNSLKPQAVTNQKPAANSIKTFAPW